MDEIWRMSPETVRNIFLPIVAFMMGGCIGSFLNVVIYRLPNDLKVNKPKRSFCPNCKTQIPMWLNIPLLSWLMLRGRCKWCDVKISSRYFMVELMTAVCFLAVYHLFFQDPPMSPSHPMGLDVVVCYWILVALLIAATFIDFDHMIIPDSITIGGCAVGLIASGLVPELHGEANHLRGLWMGIVGACAGYALLWGVVNAGKIMFGRLKFDFEEPTAFSVSQPKEEENPIIKIGDFEQDYGFVFGRPTDRLVMDVTDLKLNGQVVEKVDSFRLFLDRLEVNGESRDLEGIKSIEGNCTRAVVPREAMGMGDVKFIAMIGAFLGWKAILFTVFAASVIGAVIGILQKTIAKDKWSREFPFGPYLALGAFLFLFAGSAIIAWYSGLLQDAFRR